MTIKLPDLDDRVLLNCDGEGQTFIRDDSGMVVVQSGSGDFSNAGGCECFLSWLVWLPWGCNVLP